MGQAISLKILQHKIQSSFSSRVLVSHGLFGTPQHGGSFVVCELDSTPRLMPKEGSEKKTKFVIQVIHGQDAVGRFKVQQESTESGRDFHMCPLGTDVGVNIDSNVVPILAMLAAFAPRVSIQSASYVALLDTLSSQDFRGFCDSNWDFSHNFQEHRTDSLHGAEKNTHPNLVPLLGAFKAEEDLFLVYPKAPYSLQDIMFFSPDALRGDEHIALLTYGLLAGLAHCHSMGFAHGNLKSSNILLTDSLWCWLSAPRKCIGTGSVGAELQDRANLDSSEWSNMFRRWWTGHVSNYDYLLFLNRLAGRKWGDRCFHPVMPWVIDFCHKPDDSSDSGWRDLSKSKWRLAKGDEQLDFTYNTADIPHHVSDECLSELAVCVYKARILPLVVLRHAVRSVYEPNEYPATMSRLYQWTPDECIPEFYSDSDIFFSVHLGMNDLAVPSWAENPKHFIALHRAALESNHVSMQLHHWIDLTFGYKLSGQAAVSSKNVPLKGFGPMTPRASGRRQLFSVSHPPRQQHRQQASPNETSTLDYESVPKAGLNGNPLKASYGGTSPHDKFLASSDFTRFVVPLEELENALSFSENNMHFIPVYKSPAVSAEMVNQLSSNLYGRRDSSDLILDLIDKEDNTEGLIVATKPGKLVKHDVTGCLDIEEKGISWSDKATISCSSEAVSGDIFAVGCIIAELYLRRSLFDPCSAAAYSATGVIPCLVEQLPLQVQPLVRAAIDPHLSRRPSAEILLKSCFSTTTQSAYHILSQLHLFGPEQSRVKFATSIAEAKAFQILGQNVVELCASPLLSILSLPVMGIDENEIVVVLTELLRGLKFYAAIQLLLPVVRQLLLSQECVRLKVALLQPSFIRELRKTLGNGAYLEHIHLAIIANLQDSPDKRPAAAACSVLISMCHELGLPIILHQTVAPILRCFGRDIRKEGIDMLVGIGKCLGEPIVTKHLIPPLLVLLNSEADASLHGGSAQANNWDVLAMFDAISALDRLIVLLPPAKLVPQLLREASAIYIQIVLHHLNSNLAQCAVKALLTSCEHAGQVATSIYVLPYLKQVFEKSIKLEEPGRSYHDLEDNMEKLPCVTQEHLHQSRIQIKPHGPAEISVLYIMYPALASILGINLLRQGLSSWRRLEQTLLEQFNWKLEGESPHPNENEGSAAWSATSSSSVSSGVNPASLLLDGVGWSLPQLKVGKQNITAKVAERSNAMDGATSCDKEAWSWVPCKQDGWKTGVTFSRAAAGCGLSGHKDLWELNAMVVHAWRAHNGAIRALDVAEDESTILTAGRGPKGAACVRQWKFATTECVMEYGHHSQTLQDVCYLKGSDRIASCDGSIHIWDRHTAEPIFCLTESPGISFTTESNVIGSPVIETRVAGPAISATEVGLMNLSRNLTADIYTCLHYMPIEEKILTGTYRGCIRFIDVTVGQLLFSWRCNLISSPEAAYITTVTSSESSMYPKASSWIASGDSAGNCKVLDQRSGTIIANWRAHNGLISQLEPFDDHCLVSSSLDKTLSLWDLRRGAPLQLQIFQGHNAGVTSFATCGNDLLSAAGNKIALSTLRKSRVPGERMHALNIQAKALGRDGSTTGWSGGSITSIKVLTHSRYLLVGTEEGKLKICT